MPLREKAFEKLEDLLSINLLTAYDVADFIDENKEDADLIFAFWLDFMHDVLLIKNDASMLIGNKDYKDKLIGLSYNVSEELCAKAIENLITAQKMRKKYVSLKTLSLRLAFSIKR